MIIVAGGDSFVYGSELADCDETHFSNSTFPVILAQRNNYGYVCAARPGNSNDAIARMLILECEKLLDQNQSVAVIAVWTFVNRYEFLFNYKINSPISPWCSITPHNTGKKEVQDFKDCFYKHVGSNDNFANYNTLTSILLLQNYLISKNIPYMFLPADNHFYTGQIDSNVNIIKILHKCINWDKWYFFPHAEEQWNTTTPRGFYQWAVENKYPIGAHFHPLEEAHRDAAKLIKEKFDEMVKKLVQ